MLTQDLIFGKENTAYAVLALYSDAINEKPVVVSLHLGAKMAYSHMQQMRSRGGHIQFVVRKIRINGSIEIIDDPQLVHEQAKKATSRMIHIVTKKE
ncbi:MAG: hypothetical protein Q4A74_03210 [Cardiobacteriaceae bacterium]|nr:hypothetical protein [Cardiobacteriaceae bacterium]